MGKKLSNPRFTDDIVLLANSANEIKQAIEELDQLSKETGLHMNPTKTKLMTNSRETNITINGNHLEYVHEYTYLGQILSFNNSNKKEVSRRIAAAWSKFWSLKFILTDKSYTTQLKREVMDKCILPVLLYGSQTWSLTRKERESIMICQRKMERKILNIKLSDKIPNKEIRRRTGIKDADTAGKELKWKWAGHVVRRNFDRWTHRVTAWDPRIGKRRRGRQTTRWSDDLRKTFGQQWTTVAKDREKWTKLVK